MVRCAPGSGTGSRVSPQMARPSTTKRCVMSERVPGDEAYEGVNPLWLEQRVRGERGRFRSVPMLALPRRTGGVRKRRFGKSNPDSDDGRDDNGLPPSASELSLGKQ